MLTPSQEWWTAAELADAGLPDVPTTKRGVNILAKKLAWNGQTGFARKRATRGGGWEYSWKLLPQRAQQALLTREVKEVKTPEAAPMARDDAWAWFEKLPTTVQDKARHRLSVIEGVEAIVAGGLTKDQAARDMAAVTSNSVRSIWNWFALIEGIRRDDRLPYLAPRNRLNPAPSRATEVDPDFGDLIKSDFLREEAPTFTSVYDRAKRIAKRRGIPFVTLSAAKRWLDREVSEVTQLLARKGADYVKAMYPPQERDKTSMHAMEAVNADFHKFDVFVRFPGERGRPDEIARPQMVAMQDVYSGRILAWRIDRNPNSTAVQMCIGDMIEQWGIPFHMLLDNGREFAAKTITGGARTRYRFKVKEDDIPGLLTQLGCNIHWATPYHGQAKPIERAFRDMCDRVAKHPSFAGAYTGNGVNAKPENYQSRAVPLEEFLKVVAEELEHHNTRQGRRSEVAYGRSFADVFDESYAVSPIRKATAAQRRLWLMGAEGIRANTKTGALMFHRNRFWADWMHSICGKKVVARFDFANLWDGLHVYALTGEYLGHAPCLTAAGFFDVAEAKAHAKARGDWMRAERESLKAHRNYTAAQIGQMLDDAAPEPTAPATVEAKVVRMVPAGNTRPQPAPREDAGFDAAHSATIADLTARRAAAPEEDRDGKQAFARALELDAQVAKGEAITPEQKRWLAGYKTTSEYRSWVRMYEDFGPDILAK